MILFITLHEAQRFATPCMAAQLQLLYSLHVMQQTNTLNARQTLHSEVRKLPYYVPCMTQGNLPSIGYL